MLARKPYFCSMCGGQYEEMHHHSSPEQIVGDTFIGYMPHTCIDPLANFKNIANDNKKKEQNMSEQQTQYSHLIHLHTKPQQATAVEWVNTQECFNYLEKVFLKDVMIEWWYNKIAISYGKEQLFAKPHEYIVKTGDSIEICSKEELDTKFEKI